MLFRVLIFLLVSCFSAGVVRAEADLGEAKKLAKFEQDHYLTKSVLGVLKDSSTIHRGSEDWKDTIQISGKRIRTQVVALDDKNYFGLQASLIRKLHQNELVFTKDALSASFTLENQDGIISIRSTLRQTEIWMNMPFRYDRKKIERMGQPLPDSHAKCRVKLEEFMLGGQVTTKTNAIQECDIVIPLDKFMALIGG